MDVAAAVVGFVSLSGQVLQGCNYLCNFFGDASDAHEVIVSISAELYAVRSRLEGFQLLLLEVQAISPASLTVQQDPAVPLKLCQDAIQKLQTFVDKHADLSVSTESRSASAQVRKAWNKLDVARKGAQLKSHISQLEAAKSSLLAAQTSIQLALELKQLNESREGRRNLQQFRDEHTASAEIVKDTKTLAVDIRTLQEENCLLTTATNTSLDQVVSHTRTLLERSTLSDQQSHQADVASKFTQDAIAMLGIDLRKGLENLPAMFAPMIENTIAKSLAQHNASEWPGVGSRDLTCGDTITKVREGSTHNDTRSLPRSKGPESTPQLDQSASSITHIDSALVPTRSISRNEQLVYSAQPVRRSPKRQQTRKSIFNVWFGRIEIRTSVTEQEDDVDSNYSLLMRLQARQTTVKLLPSLWFLKTGLLFQMGDGRPTMSHPGWDNRLRVIRTHRDDSSVVEIIARGDYLAFRQLLERREITPFDLVATSSNLRWPPFTLFEIVVHKWYRNLEDGKVVREKGMLDMARLLADCGVDCGLGWSLHTVLKAESRAQNDVALDLFRVIMTQSQSDPFEDLGWRVAPESATGSFQLIVRQDEWDLSEFRRELQECLGYGAFQCLVENGDKADTWNDLQQQRWHRMPAALRRSRPHCLAEFGDRFMLFNWGARCWLDERPAYWHSRKAFLEEFGDCFAEYEWPDRLGEICFEFLEGKGAWKESRFDQEDRCYWSDRERDAWISSMTHCWSEEEAALRHSRRHCIEQYGTNFVQHELPSLLRGDWLAEEEILRLTSYDLDMEPPLPRPCSRFEDESDWWHSSGDVDCESESEIESEGEHDGEISDGWQTADED